MKEYGGFKLIELYGFRVNIIWRFILLRNSGLGGVKGMVIWFLYGLLGGIFIGRLNIEGRECFKGRRD